jgi:lipoprotein-anchoring transpeptidase ErfK/SrfK
MKAKEILLTTKSNCFANFLKSFSQGGLGFIALAFTLVVIGGSTTHAAPDGTHDRKSQQIMTAPSVRDVMYDEDASVTEFSVELNAGEPLLSSTPEDITRARLVAIINKSNIGSTAQTMKVYLDGSLIHEWKVSTGREKLETAKSGKRYVTRTPVGYFRPQRLVKLHKSKTWKADMPNSVFIYGGIAVHASSHTELLGKRASGGCIRLSPENAQTFFNLIKDVGSTEVPNINTKGITVKNKKGEDSLIKTFDALVVVENRI